MIKFLETVLPTFVAGRRKMDDAFDRAIKTFDEMQQKFDELELKSKFSPLAEHAEQLISGVKGMVNDIKDSLTDFKVIVPFDAETETVNYSIEDGNLCVKTETVDKDAPSQRTSSLRVPIPDTCDVSAIKDVIDSKDGTIKIIIPKYNTAKDVARDVRQAAQESLETAWEQLKKAADEFASLRKAEGAAEEAPKSQKPRKPKCKGKGPKRTFVRGSNGRFKKETD